MHAYSENGSTRIPRLVKMICPSTLWDLGLDPNSYPQPRGARGGSNPPPFPPKARTPKKNKLDPEFQDLSYLFFFPLPRGTFDEIQKVGPTFHF